MWPASKIGAGGRALWHVGCAGVLGLIASTVLAQSLDGIAVYPDRVPLPPGAVFEATLEERWGHIPVGTIARVRLPSPGKSPIRFTITYDPARIASGRFYGVRATIRLGEELLFVSDSMSMVIMGALPTRAQVLLRRATDRAVPPGPLVGTYWKLIELAGRPVRVRDSGLQDPKREAHLLFYAQDSAVSLLGSDGCGPVLGTYQLEEDLVTFGFVEGHTDLCCTASGELQRAFHEALRAAARLVVRGDRLELFDATGKRVAAFAAEPERSRPRQESQPSSR